MISEVHKESPNVEASNKQVEVSQVSQFMASRMPRHEVAGCNGLAHLKKRRKESMAMKLQRSKGSQMLYQSQANASWGPEEVACANYSNDFLPLTAPPSSRLLLDSPTLRRHVEPKHRTTLNKLLMDEGKMEKLLSMLRSNTFAGEIDPQHHSKYLQSPELIKDRLHRSVSRASCHDLGPKSQFKEALKKAKSHSAVSSTGQQ